MIHFESTSKRVVVDIRFEVDEGRMRDNLLWVSGANTVSIHAVDMNHLALLKRRTRFPRLCRMPRAEQRTTFSWLALTERLWQRNIDFSARMDTKAERRWEKIFQFRALHETLAIFTFRLKRRQAERNNLTSRTVWCHLVDFNVKRS